MTAGCGDLERSPGGALPSDFCQIGVGFSAGGEWRNRRALRLAEGDGHGLGEGADRVEADTGERSRLRRSSRGQQAWEHGVPGNERRGEPAAGVAHLAVERQLPERDDPRRGRHHDPGGGEDGEGDRQVVRGAALRHVGRRQVHDDPARRERVARGADRGPHPLAGFPHRSVGKADDDDVRWPPGDVGLYPNGSGLDPDEHDGRDGGEHPRTVPRARDTVGGAALDA